MSGVDEIFVQNINSKKEKAFHELFQRFYNYLVVYVMRKIKSQEIAEDIVQETFVSIWEGDKEFNSYVGFKQYLYNAVNNKCLDIIKHKNVQEKYIDYTLKNSEESDTDENLMREEIFRKLYIAINDLPYKCREVFRLHMDGKKNEEISSLLNLSILTVKTHKKNAMKFLRERLGVTFFFLKAIGIF